MATCLVTGGAGFIGSHVVEALLARGHTVRVLDNFSTGRRANLAHLRECIDLRIGDLTDLEAVRAAARGVDVVFHQGALASVPRSVADPAATHQACATGTLHVLMTAREAGVRRVIYAASSSAYGASTRLPKQETDPTLPLSPYAVAKLTGEQYCAAFTHVYGLETVRLRYFNVFGPRQPPDSPYAAVIPLFMQSMLEGRPPTVHGDGQQSRDFTFVDDVVQANLLAARSRRSAGKVYNIAYGAGLNLLQLVGFLNELLGTDIKPLFEAQRPGDVRHSLADTYQAQADLGYCPCTDVRKGLQRCLEYAMEHRTVKRNGVSPKRQSNGAATLSV
jgi:UDP-glucose 4-epimerase